MEIEIETLQGTVENWTVRFVRRKERKMEDREGDREGDRRKNKLMKIS